MQEADAAPTLQWEAHVSHHLPAHAVAVQAHVDAAIHLIAHTSTTRLHQAEQSVSRHSAAARQEAKLTATSMLSRALLTSATTLLPTTIRILLAQVRQETHIRTIATIQTPVHTLHLQLHRRHHLTEVHQAVVAAYAAPAVVAEAV